MNVNLLPRSFLVRQLVWRRLRQWCVAWFIVSAGIAWVNFAQYRAAVDARNELAALDEQCAPLRRMQQRQQEHERQLAQGEVELGALQRLAPDELPLALLAIVADGVQATNQQLQIERLQLTHPRRIPRAAPAVTAAAIRGISATPPAPPDAQQAMRVTLQGLAVDDDAVAALVAALRDRGVFRHVELTNCSEFAAAGGSGRRFEIHCTGE